MTAGQGASGGAYTWPDILTDLVAGADIGAARTGWAMDQIMGGQTSDAVLGAFLVALVAKGETVEELRALADTMLAHAARIDIAGADGVDIVGTGGDRAKTVNISTMAALVIAGAGVPVVKHGNRASSSASGSADVLEALGVNLSLPLDAVARAYREVGITFCFANLFHPSMRFAAPTRRELAIGTSFNVLGPLTNPARPGACAIGVASARHAPLVAGVLAERGTSALVFRGENGLDELTSTAVNRVWWVRGGDVAETTFDARDLGIGAATISELRGADATFNAGVARAVLDGTDNVITQTVALNAAAALLAHRCAAEPVTGDLDDELALDYDRAMTAIRSGAARDVLETWVAFSAREG